MVLGELNVLKSAVDRLIVLIQHADAQQDNAGKIAVALQLAEILAAENDLILIDELGIGGEQHIVCRALAGRAQFKGGVLLQDELAHAGILPETVRVIIPDLRAL